MSTQVKKYELLCEPIAPFCEPWRSEVGVPRMIARVSGNLSVASLTTVFSNPMAGKYPFSEADSGQKVNTTHSINGDALASGEPVIPDHLTPLQPVIEQIWSTERMRLKSLEHPKYATILAELVTAGARGYYRDDWHKEGAMPDRFFNYSFATHKATELIGAVTAPFEVWFRDGTVDHRAPVLAEPSDQDRFIFWVDFSY